MPAQLLQVLSFAERACLVSHALHQQGAFCFEQHVGLTCLQPCLFYLLVVGQHFRSWCHTSNASLQVSPNNIMFAAVLLWAASSSLQSCIENEKLPDHAVCNVTQACIYSAPDVEQCTSVLSCSVD